MADPFTLSRRIGLSDRTRLMAFSIAILLVVSLSAMVVTRYHFELALRSGNEERGLAPRELTSIEPGASIAAAQLPADERARSTLLALVETLALIIAGGTLLVRVCNPFIRRLEESDARIRAIVCTAGDGIITIDQQGTINSFNRAAERMFLTIQENVLGRNIDELIALPSQASFAKEQLGGEETAQNSNQGATGRRGNGVQFPLEFSLARVPLGERAIFTVIVRDTTEREAAGQLMRAQMFKLQEVKEILEAKAAELVATNRELDDFTYIASHDLKEPLRGISAYCQILLEDYGERLDSDGERRLQALVGLCQRLGRLIDDLLTYSQIRHTQSDQGVADLNEVVADVLQTLGPTIDDRRALVRVEGVLPKLTADPVWLGEVFRNLIANAMKFNESPRPTVEIGCLAGATIYVRDNGIGIEACHHEEIFTMFRRLHGRRQYDGTGAGLTFVRKIVEAHGGRVWVESQPGQGSTFFFTLTPESSIAPHSPKLHEPARHELRPHAPARCAVG